MQATKQMQATLGVLTAITLELPVLQAYQCNSSTVDQWAEDGQIS